MNKEDIKIITLGDIFHNLETKEQAFKFLKYIKNQQQELERYKNNIKRAFEVINTQMKNLSKGEAENLRIIKFNLIKGSCTWGDLTTEEDYKY